MRLPGGHPHHVFKGAHRQALLDRVHDLCAAPLDVRGEVRYEVLLGQPGESLLIDDQMAQRRRRRASAEQSAKRFALIETEGGDVDERHNVRLIRAQRSHELPAVGVTSDDCLTRMAPETLT